MQNEEYLLTSQPPIEMTVIARSACSSRQSVSPPTSPLPKRPNHRWAHVKAKVDTKGPSPKKYASYNPSPLETEANRPETRSTGPCNGATVTQPTGFDDAAFQLRMSRLELPELLPEGDEDSVEYAPPTNAYGVVIPSHMGWDWRTQKPTTRNPFSHPMPPMGIKAEREYIAKLDMENFDLKFRLYFLKEAMDKMSPDGRILAKENAHLNTEITTLKAELDHYREQMKLFDEQKSQFHQRSVSKDKEVYAVRAELQATQQALKEMDDRREDLERDSRDLRAQNQHLQYQIRVLEESCDNNPGSREEENKLKPELKVYRSSMTDLTGLVNQLQGDIVAERAEKQQSRAELKTALTQLDQEKSALLDMSSRMSEQDSQLSNLHNESQAIKDEADGLRKEVACLKKAVAKKDDVLRNATDMLNDINLQRDADYHALEAMRKEAQANQGELGIQNQQLKQELASEKQNNNSLIAQLELLRAKNSNDVSSARLEVESLKIQAARLNEELDTSRNQHLLATQQLQTLTAENACLKDTIDHSSRSNSAQAEFSKLQNEVEQRSQEHRNELSKVTEEHERLLRCAEGERKAVVQTLETRTRDLSVLHEEIETMKKQVSKAKLILKEREKMMSEVEKASQETERLQTLNTKYSQDLNELKAKLHDQERLNAAANREIDALQEQIKSREDTLYRTRAEFLSLLEQHLDEKTQQELDARQRDLSATCNKIRELERKLEQAGKRQVLERRIADAKIWVSNEHSSQQGCLDRHNVPTSASFADDQRKVWKLNEKLMVTQSQLATTEHECNKYQRALRYREAAIRQATKILESNLQELAC
ncbi:hypothetical protein SeMB42_g06584 [Synchytrium endobioticum]|uniref:Centrosomin N-terminal motif 1 domain-containing protein n=1 Tax=Synchytrium endobioticum TaxID=286115 RepID=A0A507CZP1_9FUNG|nr:hypothetical protein SeMB42_g06584 [Synchytrium endobioticum]TPX44616.1 hypothetical protein SeLEV6574_g04384 [Synchytrium endobioticum]